MATVFHREGADMGVTKYLQPTLTGKPAEKAIAGVQKPLDMDGTRQNYQRYQQQRTHHHRRQHLSRCQVQTSQNRTGQKDKP